MIEHEGLMEIVSYFYWDCMLADSRIMNLLLITTMVKHFND